MFVIKFPTTTDFPTLTVDSKTYCRVASKRPENTYRGSTLTSTLVSIVKPLELANITGSLKLTLTESDIYSWSAARDLQDILTR